VTQTEPIINGAYRHRPDGRTPDLRGDLVDAGVKLLAWVQSSV
jgi:hypothetical protein